MQMLEALAVLSGVLAATDDGGGAAAAAIFLILYFAIAIAFYVAYSYAIYRIAVKMNYDKAWLSWVPVAQYWVIGECAGKDQTFNIIMVVAYFICGCVSMVMVTIAFMDLAERMGQERYMGLLTIIPLIGLIFMYLIGNGEPVAYAQPAGYGTPQGYAPPPQGYAPPPQGYAPPPPPPRPDSSSAAPEPDSSSAPAATAGRQLIRKVMKKGGPPGPPF